MHNRVDGNVSNVTASADNAPTTKVSADWGEDDEALVDQRTTSPKEQTSGDSINPFWKRFILTVIGLLFISATATLLLPSLDSGEPPPQLLSARRLVEVVPPTVILEHHNPTKLVIQHLPRMGGKSAFKILKSLTIPYMLSSTGSIDRFAKLYGDARGTFVISTIRNPCDWYVSNWKGDSATCSNKSITQRFCGPADDVLLFQSYMRSRQGRGPPFMSWEIARRTLDTKGFAVPSQPCDTYGAPKKRCGKDHDFSDAFSMQCLNRGVVDCWVHLENYFPDLKQCLLAYAAISNRTTVEQGIPYLTFITNKLEEISKDVHFNQIRGRACDEYYTPRLASYVMEKDKDMFARFGYSTCCGPAPQPASVWPPECRRRRSTTLR